MMIPTARPGWKTVKVGDVLTVQVPPEAHEQDVRPIDSMVGVINGPGYQVTYDYGRYGERLDRYQDRADFDSKTRSVDGRQAREVTFVDREESPDHPFVRLLQVPGQGQNTLTLRVSCVDEATCAVADQVFDSVTFAR